MKIALIAEHDNNILKSATLHALSAATKLGGFIDLFIIGSKCQAVAERASQLANVQKVIVYDDPVYLYQLAENTADLIADVCQSYDYLLVGATTFGKNLLPRVAALLDVAMISDVIEIVSADTFIRPIYAGNVLCTVQSKDAIKLLSIRTTAFPEAQFIKKDLATIQQESQVIPNSLSEFENHTLTQSSRPELTAARVVISGGRGMKSAENFHLLECIADLLGAAVGASRAAVDAGFAPNDYQIGQTGKVVAPDLYIAVGISGAIQHVAGMKDSKIIVAINNDVEAPIFEIADFGIVGDLFKVLPELQNELEKMRA